MTTYSVIGTRVASEGGHEKVSGQTLYPADIALPGMTWGKVLRSPLPHARIVNIDTSRAERVPGVRAVITGADTAGMRVGRLIYDVPLLADGKVRFVGERVAAVAADDPEAAEEGLAQIDVEYEELPAVFGAVEAMEAGAPLVHEEGSSYRSSSGPIVPQGNVGYQEGWSGGDLERGFRESDLVLEHTFTTPWVHQGYIEPFTCVVDIDGQGRIQVWANNKQPFGLRRQLSESMGIPAERIRVNPCGIGGDFGGKAGAMDAPLAYLLSQRSGHPVKMVMSYIEELMAGNPRHPSVITIRTGVKRDGTLWARSTNVVFNAGAYAGFRGSPGLRGGRQAGGGPYVTPNFKIDLYMVYTNNVPCGSYRAPGEPQAVFAVESHTDMIAHELGMDPYEFRLRNLVHEGNVSGTGQTFKYVRAEETLRRAAEVSGWDSEKRGRHFGRGIALGQRPAAGATSVARVTVDADARVTLHTAVPDTGVGAHTVGRQVVAEDLGVPLEQVSLHRWDTDAVPFDTGAGAATTRIAGNAAYGAAAEARKELTRLAAEFYGWPEERIVFGGSRVFVEGDPEGGVGIEDLAARAVSAMGAPISGDSTYSADQPAEVTSYCAQVADVEVDPETGQVTVHRIVTAHDVGTILNPLGHQGQIDGAVVQGLGYALMEELQAEEGRISTLSLGEAKMPTSMDIPELVTELVQDEVESPDELGPYRGKGIGENPISPVAPAIANAVYDAVGVRITDLPVTAEKVLRGLGEF